MLLLAALLHVAVGELTGWTGSSFPDVRGPSVDQCGDHIPGDTGYLPYVCDPDKVLNRSEIARINQRLHKLATGTPCHCQRRSQCMTDDTKGDAFYLGFVVSVAIVKRLQMTIHTPSEQHLTERAAAFSRTLQGRWALGDCGNSAIIFVWQQYKKIYISTARVTSRYLTDKEKAVILAQVKDFLNKDNWGSAIIHILDNVQNELLGEPEGRVDTGTLSLIIAVGVAVLLVTVITCCVCAFRCCGNLRPPPDARSRVSKAVHRVDSLRAEVVRRGSQLRRSFSRSPKFAHHPAPTTAAMDENQTRVLLGYYRDADTTMV
uniref:Uncharacterized protein n=1 Tax=Plectus sambesii TaxID=2011161 RepID=A0A914UJV9_9BILA